MNLITHNPLSATLTRPRRHTGNPAPAWRLALRGQAANAVTCARLVIALGVSILSVISGFPESAARPLPTFVDAAAWLIAACILLDGLDGHLARRLNIASRFGARLDALADVWGFAIAPLLLLFVALPTALRDSPALVALVGFTAVLYSGACLMRLIRFQGATTADEPTARSSRQPGSHSGPRPARVRTFCGLPTPAAAAVLVALAMLLSDDSAAALSNLLSPASAALITATTLLALSALLISGTRYVHLADAMGRLTVTRRATALALAGAALLIIAVAAGPAPAFAAGSLAYLVFGRAAAPRGSSTQPHAACTLEAA